MASQRKNATIIYVPAIPKVEGGIGEDIPTHVKVEYFDEEGRRCLDFLTLSEEDLEKVRNMPNQ